MRRVICVLVWLFVLSAVWPNLGIAADSAPRVKETQAAPQKKEQAENDQPSSKKDAEDEYELQRLLVDTLDQVQRNYVREISRRKLIEAAIKGVLTELDPYSSYISPEEMEQFRTVVESEFGGIGIQIESVQGRLRVLSPLVGTPAYRAGIMAGDWILQIDGKSTDHVSMDEAMRRVRGKAGSTLTLTVVHAGKTAGEIVTLKREAIHVETVLGDRRKADDGWDYLLDSEKRIAYIRLTSFSRDTGTELRKALTELKKENVRGLILDLRSNPGGLLSSAIEIADLFVSEGRIVSTAGRNSPERVWTAHKEGTFEGFPMAILVNRYSASASEIVAACLQDHKRAVVVGERTWGKGSVQNVIPLNDGAGEAVASRQEPHSALKLTTAGYRRPSGKNIDRAPNAKDTDEWGVTPDKGLELRLDDRELMSLSIDRRQRDVVQPKAPAPEETAASGSQPGAKTEPPKPEAKKPEASGFVDRQLQMALNYLTGELARAR